MIHVWKIRDKVLRLLMKKGHLIEGAPPEEELLPFGSPVLGGCYTAAVKGTVCLGSKRGTYVQREGRVPGIRFVEFSGDGCAEADGFTLHANVRVHGRKRKQLERLHPDYGNAGPDRLAYSDDHPQCTSMAQGNIDRAAWIRLGCYSGGA